MSTQQQEAGRNVYTTANAPHPRIIDIQVDYDSLVDQIVSRGYEFMTDGKVAGMRGIAKRRALTGAFSFPVMQWAKNNPSVADIYFGASKVIPNFNDTLIATARERQQAADALKDRRIQELEAEVERLHEKLDRVETPTDLWNDVSSLIELHGFAPTGNEITVACEVESFLGVLKSELAEAVPDTKDMTLVGAIRWLTDERISLVNENRRLQAGHNRMREQKEAAQNQLSAVVKALRAAAPEVANLGAIATANRFAGLYGGLQVACQGYQRQISALRSELHRKEHWTSEEIDMAVQIQQLLRQLKSGQEGYADIVAMLKAEGLDVPEGSHIPSKVREFIGTLKRPFLGHEPLAAVTSLRGLPLIQRVERLADMWCQQGRTIGEYQVKPDEYNRAFTQILHAIQDAGADTRKGGEISDLVCQFCAELQEITEGLETSQKPLQVFKGLPAQVKALKDANGKLIGEAHGNGGLWDRLHKATALADRLQRELDNARKTGTYWSDLSNSLDKHKAPHYGGMLLIWERADHYIGELKAKVETQRKQLESGSHAERDKMRAALDTIEDALATTRD